MLAYLERVFGDPNRRANAEYEFRILHQEGQDFNTFWTEFLRLSIELDQNKSTLISDLTFKLSHDIRRQLINGDEPSTNLFKYAEWCQRVYQGLKDLTRVEAEVLEECVVAPARKVSTIRTAKSSHQPMISKKNQLMKKERCFSCREVGHKTMDCQEQKPRGHRKIDVPSEKKPTNKQTLMSEREPRSKLSVSRITMQKSEQKESRTKALQAEVPRAEKPRAEKSHVDERPLIVSSSSLPGDFFAEEALVTSCTLGNNEEIKTTALLDTGATGYSFVDSAMAQRICNDLLIEPIRLSKPKAIRGFDGKQAPSVTHAIYPIMTVKNHRETTTPMLITKLGQHQIIFGKPWMKKHGAVLDMRNDQLTFWPGHYQHDVALKLPTAEPQAEKPCVKPCVEEPRAEEPHASRPVKILKRPTNELPELLPYLLPSTQGVSKVVNTPEAVKPQEKKPSTIAQKPELNAKVKDKKPSVERMGKNDKPLDLALISGAPFMHLARSKKQKAEIYAISMRDIEYQLNKGTKPPTDLKTVVPTEYPDFLDVFSKDISNTLRPYGKYNHKIELLKDKDLASDLGHSAF